MGMIIFNEVRAGVLAPTDEAGRFIPDRATWHGIVVATERYYAQTTDEEIESHNSSMMAPGLPSHYEEYTPKRSGNGYHKRKISPMVRREVFERDDYKCCACGSREDITIDHIYPESKGGSSDPSNLQTLCRVCNSKKGDALPDGQV